MVSDCSTLEEAVEVLDREITYYANKHIPVKTKPLKDNGKPFISDETKEIINEKAKAWSIYKATGRVDDYDRYKTLSKLVQKEVGKDRTKWMKKGLGSSDSSKDAWRKAKLLMGKSQQTSPKSILVEDKYETNPSTIAEAFAVFQESKIKELRDRTAKDCKIDPITRLKDWLAKKGPI